MLYLQRLMILLLVLASACSDDTNTGSGDGDDLANDTSPDNGTDDGTGASDLTGGDDPGGNSGAEGNNPGGSTEVACTRDEETLDSLDQVSALAGFSPTDLLDAIGSEHRVPMRWLQQDSQPAIDASRDMLALTLTPDGTAATASACDDDPEYPEDLRAQQPPELQLPVTLTLQSDDGRLDASLPAVLLANDSESARLDVGIDLAMDPNALGELGELVTDAFSDDLQTHFEIAFEEGDTRGVVMGPFSPHSDRPCLFSAYAVWPAESCSPPPGEEAERARAQLGRSYDLVWDDNSTTSAEVEITVRDEVPCDIATNEELSQPNADIRITSEDGRVSLSLPAHLDSAPAAEGGEADAVADAVARLFLTREELGQLDAEADADAAVVELWLSDQPVPDEPPIQGRLEVLLLDRSGFDTALPRGNPGGAPWCFDARNRPQSLMAATLSAGP
ncbi:MAG: hypothetical protein OXT09_29420 [Myxococcales bacterium]|nr:hypothetical protein [Myxococcales bacterium]